MKKLFVGIDVSKDVFDACLVDEQHQIVSAKNKFPNTPTGIDEFCKYLAQHSKHTLWVCMEHTGHYGALLAYEFNKRSICFSLVNPLEIKHSIGMTRGKNDAVDACRIAQYASSNKHKLEPYKLPGEQLQRLKVLMSVRQRYVKVMVQLKNGLKSLEVLQESLDVEGAINEHNSLINRLEVSVKNVESQMNDIVNANHEIKDKFEKIRQVIGVGPLTAILCIAATDNFTKFKNGRKFSCHCGLAPFEYTSGSSVRGKTKTSPLSNKELKTIFFRAASTAIQHDPQLKSYFNRKVAEGKHKLSILNAVANKIVLRIFAVAQRNEPFVKLSA